VAATLADLVEEVRPEARQIAVGLVRQELAGLAVSLNGNHPSAVSVAAPAPESAEEAPETAAAAADPAAATSDRPPAVRRCTACKVDRPASEFTPSLSQCKTCRAALKRERHRRAAAAAAAEEEER